MSNPLEVKRYMVKFRKDKCVYTQCFEVYSRYEIDESKPGLGIGAYGAVAEAYDTVLKRPVAIKKLEKVFNPDNPLAMKSTLRELKLLRHFSTKTKTPEGFHPNILRTYGIMVPLGNEGDSHLGLRERIRQFDDVYVVLEKYDMSLRELLVSKTPLEESMRAFFMYQLLRGLKAIVSASCVHRDLKPENMLIKTASCDLAICDFGSGRGYEGTVDHFITTASMTTTQCYRPPEAFLNDLEQDESLSPLDRKMQDSPQALDMWSCGAIMAELMKGEVLCRGLDLIDQISKIFTTVAPLDPQKIESLRCRPQLKETLREIAGAGRNASIRKIFEGKKDSTGEEFSAEEIDLLEKMLQVDAEKRISIDEALKHEFFTQYELDAETVPEVDPFTFRIEDTTNAREEIWKECLDCNPDISQYVLQQLGCHW